MPWDHCAHRGLLDDAACPACGITKEAWTVSIEVTRNFKVTRRAVVRISLVDAAGVEVAGEPFSVAFADGSRVEGALDDLGTARVPAAGAGAECEVTFPRWAPDDLEVVAADGVAAADGEDAAADREVAAGDGEVAAADAGADDGFDAQARFRARTSGALRLRVRPAALWDARWGAATFRVDEVVPLQVRTRGLRRGTLVSLEVLEHDADGDDDPVTRMTAAVRGGRVRRGWHAPWVDDGDDAPTELDRATGFDLPELVFVARHGELEARCADVLEFGTDLVLPIQDAAGQRLPDAAYTLRCGAQVKRGRTDGEGILREAGVGPNFTLELGDGRRVVVRTAPG